MNRLLQMRQKRKSYLTLPIALLQLVAAMLLLWAGTPGGTFNLTVSDLTNPGTPPANLPIFSTTTVTGGNTYVTNYVAFNPADQLMFNVTDAVTVQSWDFGSASEPPSPITGNPNSVTVTPFAHTTSPSLTPTIVKCNRADGSCFNTYTLAMMCPMAVVSDPNNTYKVDNTNPVLTYLKFGLWDNAFDTATPANVLNGNAENANFVGSDSRRFYIRVCDPTAMGDATKVQTVTADWFTQKSGGADDDHPSTDTVTLTETAAGSGIFASKALMLVTDEVDNGQTTNTGLSGGGNAAEGAADHRLRRAALGDTMCYSYTPGASGSTKQTFSVPIFGPAGSTDAVKTMTVQVANLYQGSSFTLAQSDSYIQAIQKSVQSHYAIAGIKVNFQYAYGTQNDCISVPSSDGIDLNEVNGGSGSATGDEGRLATIVKTKYAGADSHTIFLILVQQFEATLDENGNTDQDQGETISAGLNAYVNNVDAPAVYCSYVARVGLGGQNPPPPIPTNDSTTTSIPPHELGHQLTCPTAAYVNNNNHYNGPQSGENLMIMSASDPSPGSVSGAKRLWDDSGHAYPNIPITKQIDSIRQSPLIQ